MNAGVFYCLHTADGNGRYIFHSNSSHTVTSHPKFLLQLFTQPKNKSNTRAHHSRFLEMLLSQKLYRSRINTLKREDTFCNSIIQLMFFHYSSWMVCKTHCKTISFKRYQTHISLKDTLKIFWGRTTKRKKTTCNTYKSPLANEMQLRLRDFGKTFEMG